MKNKLVIFLIFLNILPSLSYPVRETRVYDNNWYIRADFNPYANKDRKYFDPPKVGEKAKPIPKWKRILWRADKQHSSLNYMYQPHVSGREYKDCSYFLYVDCSNFSFCRCWQCRDYVYPFVERD